MHRGGETAGWPGRVAVTDYPQLASRIGAFIRVPDARSSNCNRVKRPVAKNSPRTVGAHVPVRASLEIAEATFFPSARFEEKGGAEALLKPFALALAWLPSAARETLEGRRAPSPLPAAGLLATATATATARAQAKSQGPDASTSCAGQSR
ncbi:hypothetical protein JHW43_001830 [Diplocarpon mali]|nr:hypothetical protein JHW43_001830 [Diplocarpon mali]